MRELFKVEHMNDPQSARFVIGPTQAIQMVGERAAETNSDHSDYVVTRYIVSNGRMTESELLTLAQDIYDGAFS